MRKFFFLFLFIMLPLVAENQSPGSFVEFTEQAAEGQTYNYWGEFVNMLLTLAFILVLIFLSVWALKKIMRSRLKHLNRSTAIKILERRPLNPKSSLYLVDILGKGIVVSESPSGIQLVTEFAEGVNVEQLMEEKGEVPSPISFKKTLADKIRKLALNKTKNA